MSEKLKQKILYPLREKVMPIYEKSYFNKSGIISINLQK